MKLLYTCADRADDHHHWSGLVWNCRNALEATGVEIAVLDRILFDCPFRLRLLHQLHKRLGRKTHYLQIEPAILRRAARRIAERFAQGDCDAVFCPGTGVPVYTYLPASIPVFTYLDATKRSWIGAYFGLETLCDRSRRHVDEVDRVSLLNNTLTIFSSDWAKSEAARDYGVPAHQMAVIPLGANLMEVPARGEVEGWIATRPRDPLRLLFWGKEWERKGGPETLALVRELRTRGVATTLDIVGCTPVLEPADRFLVRIHGFVDHSIAAGRKVLHTLLRDTHLLVFLSRAEAYGFALCEAAAFGVPAFAADVGGIPTIVRHGVNGWLSRRPFSAPAAAASIIEIWQSPQAYTRAAFAARADYDARLNWGSAGRSLQQLIVHTFAQGRG
jgi:glycosyltransferase involved in cell wall biosynthesis